jgi:sec-independent protein translocase protein TatB
MFDIGWSELLVIGVVALIVVGPKDLPMMFKTLGRFTAKARGMAREFSRAMEAAADDAGVKDVAKDLRAATSAKAMGLDMLKDAATKFENWDPAKPEPGATRLAPDPAAPAPAPAAAAPATPAPAAADLGPETRALAEAQAAKRAAASAKAAETRAAKKAAAADADKQADT